MVTEKGRREAVASPRPPARRGRPIDPGAAGPWADGGEALGGFRKIGVAVLGVLRWLVTVFLGVLGPGHLLLQLLPVHLRCLGDPQLLGSSSQLGFRQCAERLLVHDRVLPFTR